MLVEQVWQARKNLTASCGICRGRLLDLLLLNKIYIIESDNHLMSAFGIVKHKSADLAKSIPEQINILIKVAAFLANEYD